MALTPDQEKMTGDLYQYKYMRHRSSLRFYTVLLFYLTKMLINSNIFQIGSQAHHQSRPSIPTHHKLFEEFNKKIKIWHEASLGQRCLKGRLKTYFLVSHSVRLQSYCFTAKKVKSECEVNPADQLKDNILKKEFKKVDQVWISFNILYRYGQLVFKLPKNVEMLLVRKFWFYYKRYKK